MLLDPLISMDDLKPWQHQCIIRSFLYQGQHQMALKYIRVQQPPLKDIEDIRLVSVEDTEFGYSVSSCCYYIHMQCCVYACYWNFS
jgi:hypothetical protein